MRRLATTLLAALGLAGAAQAQITFGIDWQASSAGGNLPAYFGTNTERGFALGTYAGNPALIVLSRNTTAPNVQSFQVHNPATGAITGSFSGATTFSGVTGGAITVNDVAITPGGAVIACNVTTNVVSSGFKCYRWTDLAAAPTVVINNFVDATSPANTRVGDAFTLTGTSGALTLLAAGNGSANVYRFTSTDDGATWTGGTVTTTGNPASPTPVFSSVPSVAPLADGSYYVKTAGRGARLYNASNVYQGEITTATIPSAASTIRAVTTATPYGTKTFLVAYQYSSDSRALVYDVTDGPATARLVASLSPLGAVGNANGSGDIELVVNPNVGDPNNPSLTVYALGTNNGIARYTSTSALPVELVAFTGVAAGTTARLAWATASETNNAGFAIERQTGAAWAQVGYVNGNGTTAERNAYAYDVTGLAAGRHSFRLRQVDLDGAVHYSATVEVAVVADGDGLAVVGANPFAARTSVAVAVRAPQTVRVELYDALGRLVATPFAGRVEGTQTVDVNGAGLPAGLYVVRVAGERFSATRTITKAD